MLRDILRALEYSVFSEKFANANGILQNIDPRIKLYSFILWILAAINISSIISLGIIFIIVMMLAITSKISFKLFFLRTAFIPLFSFIIVLPLPFITPGSKLVMIGYDKYFVSVTWEGLYKAVQFTFRIWVCVASLSLLILTTKFYKLIYSMEKIKVPTIFTSMIIITYRFIFFFINEAYRMILAKEARTVNKESKLLVMRSVAQIISTLFIRAYEKGERVYLAMIARGYTNEVRSINDIKINRKDWAFLIISSLIFFTVLLIDFWFRCYL
ncbi:MAG: cobalt ECF transporter T component CbiQ [Thermoprotei archaeon]|jgi:cobalt/nickel transport system permease protein